MTVVEDRKFLGRLGWKIRLKIGQVLFPSGFPLEQRFLVFDLGNSHHPSEIESRKMGVRLALWNLTNEYATEQAKQQAISCLSHIVRGCR